MSIELKKKQSITLTKKYPEMKQVFAGLGWESNNANGIAVDCDVSVFMLNAQHKIPSEGYFVFFNNLQSDDKAVRHLGDNRDGQGDGDDEVIEINLTAIHADIEQLLFTVTIYEPEERGHHFGLISDSFIRICYRENAAELCRFALHDRFDGSNSLIIGRLYRNGEEWDFEAIGDAFDGGLEALVNLYS